MMSEILLAATALLAFLFLHPFTTYPLSLLILRRLRAPITADPRGASPASFAVLCCMANEAAVVRQKIENSLELTRRLPNCEVLIHSDASTDGTNEVLSARKDVLKLSFAAERAGKTAGMNRLVGMTEAEILIFTDANVTVDPDGVSRLLEIFRDPEIGCVAGHLLYVNADESATAEVGSLYWRFEEGLKELESQTGSAMGADGSLFAVRRSLYRPAPVDIIDDFYASLSVIVQGRRVVRDTAFRAYERSASNSKDEYRRKVRIACGAFNCHRVVGGAVIATSPLNAYKYVSHKVLRWFSGYVLTAGAVTFAGAALALFGWPALALVVSALFAAATLARLFPNGPLGKGVEFISAIYATADGVWRSYQGERFQTWTAAASARAGR